MREVGSAQNSSVELQASLQDLNLNVGLDQLLLVPAKDSITFFEEMRAIATTSFDYDLGKWISRKNPSLPASELAFHVCVSDFCHDALWFHENATFNEVERSEVTTSL